MLAVGENARDTAERETPARAATSDAVTHGFLSLSFIDS
jgi:1-phosphatidylinositol phosphodiesterase